MSDTYETMEVRWNNLIPTMKKDRLICDELLRYARLLSNRGLVCNTFGNIVVRAQDNRYSGGVLYTKQRGVSLEECTENEIVITAIASNDLICGEVPPSNGHQMSREIMRHRSDINAVVHTHANVVCAYFAAIEDDCFRYVGNDTPLVLGSHPKILPRHINLESEVGQIQEIVTGTSCLVMPNHGFVTLGRSLSEAYHRHTAFVAEIERLVYFKKLGGSDPDRYIGDEEVESMYRVADLVIYGAKFAEHPAKS